MDIFKNGSRWVRADFHLHTRVDSEFKYTEKKTISFIEEYISKLEESDIRIGIITNHNKFDKNEFKALKKTAKKREIGLFPGVELSVKEGMHILIAFDHSWYQGDNNIQAFLENAFYGTTSYASPPYPNSRFDLKEVVEALDAFGHSYFICLAHIDDANGIHDVLNGRTFKQFVRQEAFSKVIAVQKSGNKVKYDNLCKLAGRSLACVEGTDNAGKGIKAIGSGKVTYVKIGDFNFDALKYSILDHENRLCPMEMPKINNSYIKSIELEGGLLDGTKINFSPELNTLIGIRGSGKSSILEILRYTLDINLSNQSVDKQYKKELIPYVLCSGGKATVKCVSEHGKEYTIVKILNQKEDIYQDGNIIDASISGCFKTPVYFGQKDLSNKDINFERDLIDKLIGDNLESVKQEIKTHVSKLKNTINDYKKLDRLEEKKHEIEDRIKNTQHKLKLFKEKGVEEKLKKQSQFESDIDSFNKIYENLIDYYNGLIEYIDENAVIFEEEFPDSKSSESKALYKSFSGIYKKILAEKETIDLSIEKISSLLDELGNVSNDFDDKKEALKEEFAEIQRAIDIPNLDADEFIKLNKLLTKDNAALLDIEKKEKIRVKNEKEILSGIVKLDKLWHKEYKKLLNEVDKINKSKSELEIEIEYKGRKDIFVDKIKSMCSKSGIRGAAFESIGNEYTDFIQIYRDKKKLESILNESHCAEFSKRLHKHLADLLTFQIDNAFTIKYKEKPLAQHSLGQRASALILFLLAQRECDVLIIDQPEDDLDNQTIYQDVIRELKALKGNMQFIFATHNANIPVLGDSEKVIACDYSDENIVIDAGSVDSHCIQEKIVDVMEGGKDAFEHRKQIYDLWKIT